MNYTISEPIENVTLISDHCNKQIVIINPEMNEINFPESNRFEIIDSHGRCHIKNNNGVKISLQDGGKTVKIFVDGILTESWKDPNLTNDI